MLHSRERRIEEAIKQALSRIFLQEVNDPRLPQIMTITRVSVSKDLRHAKVRFSQIPDEEEALDATEDFLKDSLSYLRTMVAREVNLKFTPELDFRYDPSPGDYQRIDQKLRDLRSSGEMGDDEEEPPPAGG